MQNKSKKHIAWALVELYLIFFIILFLFKHHLYFHHLISNENYDCNLL